MTAGGYLIGWLSLVAMVAPLAIAASRLRHRAAPASAGPLAWLADVTVTLAALLLVAELLGTLDLFERLPMIAACLTVGAVGAVAGRRRCPREATPRRPRRRLAEVLPGVIGIGMVTFGQVPQTLTALRGGMFDLDSLEYHLTKPARWVQQGSLDGVHQIFPGSLFPYYPSNAELAHGLGMLAIDSDVLSPVVNLGFIGVAFLAAWCIGERRGAGPAALAALSAILATLHFSHAGGGTAVNDIPQAACLLAALAFTAHSSGRLSETFLVGLAAGLAIGSKPTASVAGGCIAAAAVLRAWSPHGFRALLAMAFGLLLTAGFWFIRNLIWIGTPLPGKDIGPFASPAAEQLEGSSFAEAVRAGQDPITSLVNGLAAVLGPQWILIVALVAGGLLSGLWPRREGWERGAACGGLGTILAWPFTPFTMIVPFAVRYLAAALAIGAVLFAVSPWVTRGRAARALPWGFAALAVAGAVDVGLSGVPYAGAAALAAIGAVAVGVAVAGVSLPGRTRRAIAALAVPVTVLVSVPVATAYDRNRYSTARFTYDGYEAAAVKRTFDWARNVEGQRIGIDGGELQYPLFGRRLTNHVQYIGRQQPDGGFARIESCREWRHAINLGRYDYVITVPWGIQSRSPSRPSPHRDWTSTDPAAQVALEPGSGMVVFRIRDLLDPDGCVT